MNPPPRVFPPPLETQHSGRAPLTHAQDENIKQRLPAPPPHWSGYEASMKYWLLTKTEEEKRKQEEQKTQQESLRLERIKISHSMLREAISCGMPPALIPFIFTGIKAASVRSDDFDDGENRSQQSKAAYQQSADKLGTTISATDPTVLPKSRVSATDDRSMTVTAPSASATQQAYTSPSYNYPPGPSSRVSLPVAPAYMGEGSTIRPYGFQGILRRDSPGVISPPDNSGLFWQPRPNYFHPAERRDQTLPMNQFTFHHWTPTVSSPGSQSLLSEQPSLPQKRRATTEHRPTRKPDAISRMIAEYSSRESTDSPLPITVASTSSNPSRLFAQPKRSKWTDEPAGKYSEVGRAASQDLDRQTTTSHVGSGMLEPQIPQQSDEPRHLSSPSKLGSIDEPTKPIDWDRRP